MSVRRRGPDDAVERNISYTLPNPKRSGGFFYQRLEGQILARQRFHRCQNATIAGISKIQRFIEKIGSYDDAGIDLLRYANAWPQSARVGPKPSSLIFCWCPQALIAITST